MQCKVSAVAIILVNGKALQAFNPPPCPNNGGLQNISKESPILL